MEMQAEKCVMVLDGALPPGAAANTAAILGTALGRRRPDLVGPDVPDGSGTSHPGILSIPIAVLRADGPALRSLRGRLREDAFRAVTAADFTALAQRCRTYPEFLDRLGGTPEGELRYLGLALLGPKRLVDRLTGSLPLFR